MKYLFMLLLSISLYASESQLEELSCNQKNLEKVKDDFYLLLEKEKYYKEMGDLQGERKMKTYSILLGLVYGDCKFYLENK